MGSRIRLRAFGLVPGAAGLQLALHRFRVGGQGAVTALNTDLLRCLAGFLEDDEETEKLTFAQVVERSLRCCNESPAKAASHGHLVAALASAAESLDADSPFLRSARHPGFHRATAKVLQELHQWGLGAPELSAAARRLEGDTGAKLTSLAQLEADAKHVFSSLGRTFEHEHLRELLECEAHKPPFPRLLVAAGSCQNPSAAKVLLWLADNGCDVTVLLDNPSPSRGLFGGAASFASMLGVKIEPVGEANGLCDALFASLTTSSGPEVRRISCSDALSETEWALRSCLEDLERGLHPEEIAIYVRNLDQYACFLESTAVRFELKLRISRRAPLLSNRFARLVEETLRFTSSDDPRTLIPLLQCSYLGLSHKTGIEMREAVRTAYRARKNAWPVLHGWAEAHQEDVEWLHRLLQWREEALKNAQPLFAWVERLRTLIDIVPWHDSAGKGPSRSRDIRAQTALIRAVANVASVRRAVEDRPWSLREFAALCPILWRDEEYVLPCQESGIGVVTSAQGMGPVRSVYALGMLEGIFPRRRSEDPILNDEDRAALSGALALDPPLPNSFDRAKEERDEFYRLCAAAEDRITFSYPQTDEARDNVPAFYLEEIRNATGGGDTHDFPRIPFAPPAEQCRASADKALRRALDAPKEEPLPVHFLTREVRCEVAWPEDRPFTPQDLREVLRCEFRHLASKRLGIRPSREASRWFNLRKLPQAVRLVHQPSPDVATQALETALEAELETLYGDAPEWEIAMLRSGGKQMIRQWVRREFASRELWRKEADTLKVDLPFGAPGVRNEMPGGVPLMGHVAAVSRMGPYAVAHLYETHPPNTEGRFGGTLSELDTLYYGLHLLARHGAAEATAVEVESMAGDRMLMLLPRLADAPVPSRHQDGLRVLDLASGAEGSIARKSFYDEVKRRLRRAVQQLQKGGVEPIPGEQCLWCGYGELCRRSQEFGEDAKLEGADDVFETD